VKDEDLPNGTKYTILAYEKIGSVYILQKQQTFEVGEKDPKIELDWRRIYTLIIVSSGTNIPLPLKIENGDSYIEDIDMCFLYQKIRYFKPDIEKNNVIDIKLKRPTEISILINFNNMLEGYEKLNVEYVENVKIIYQKPKLVRLFNLTGVGYEKFTLPVEKAYFIPSSTMHYKIDFHKAFSVDGNIKYEFYADIKVKEHPDIGKINGLVLPLKLWHKHVFNLNPMVCGAYTGPNKTNFREFMCHDLSDEHSHDVRTRKYANKYAWGKKDVRFDEEAPYEEGSVWKEEENPCPNGLRVPTIDEWVSVLKNNEVKNIYDPKDSYVGIGKRLLLHYSNYNGIYSVTDAWWSSTDGGTSNYVPVAYYVVVNHEKRGIVAEDEPIRRSYGRKTHPMAIRCIRKLPNE